MPDEFLANPSLSLYPSFVMHPAATPSDVRRLEELWAGDFGDAYVERNRDAGGGHERFWDGFCRKFPAQRALEVGCNIGTNLLHLSAHVPQRHLYGIDVNAKSLAILRERLPEANAILAPARELPFRDGFFDLVFTVGVLIHQPEENLADVMAEVVRCSSRYVLCMEYSAERTTEVPYRGQEGALFKRDYGRLYREYFPGLVLRDQSFLSRDEGWDDVTYWVFEKTA